jgi:hypothetical protein
MLKVDSAQAEYKNGERAVVFKDGDRIGVIRIIKDDSEWLFRVGPDKASMKLTKVQGEPVVELTGDELHELYKAVSNRRI